MKLSQSNLSDSGLSWNIVKEAMARPFSPETNEELAKNEIFTAPNIGDKYPKGGKTDYEKILKDTGADQLFGTKEPKIRKFILPKTENLVIINEQEYILANVKKPLSGRGKEKEGAVPGVITVYGPVVREQDGEINWKETGKRLVQLPYEGTIDQIKRSPNAVKKEKDYINGFIAKYNEFIDKKTVQTSKGNVPVLTWQIQWAEDMINERLATIEAQTKGFKSPDRKEKKDIGNKAYESLESDYKSGKIPDMSPHDYVLMLLERKYHSKPSLEQLSQDIKNEKMPFDEKTNDILKKFLEQIINWQIRVRSEEEAKAQTDLDEKQKRMEDLESVQELTLEKINFIDDLPGEYKKAKEFVSPESIVTQVHEATTGMSQNYEELKSVRDALNGAKQVILDLPSKKVADISEVAVRQIDEFKKQCNIFATSYRTSPFIKSDKGLEINPKLFGNLGTLGNGLIAVVLRHIVVAIEDQLKRITNTNAPVGGVEQVKDTPVTPTSPLPQPVAYTKSKINKMSEGLWNFFTNRMRLK